MRLLFASALLLVSAQAASTDLVLYNGKLWTGDAAMPSATAIAIDKGRIVAVGDDTAILERATADSRRIDLKGHRVVPGINDAHTHVTTGLRSIDLEIDRAGGSDAVRKALAAQPQDDERWLTADIGMDVRAAPALRRCPAFGWSAPCAQGFLRPARHPPPASSPRRPRRSTARCAPRRAPRGRRGRSGGHRRR